MSEFSEKIRFVIKNSKLTMPYLSEMSGLSVPNLYKICQGKRLPKEKEKIFALIKALQCPKSEEIALIKSYQIELLGRDEYFCLEAVQELLPRIGRKNGVGMYYFGETAQPEADVLSGKVDCSRYLQCALMEEVRKNEKGIVKIIGGEESSYLLESIPVIFQNSRTVCEHIFRLDSRSLPESDMKNVQLISAILPAAFGGFQYRPYYYYEYGQVKNNKIQLFHSAVILPEQAILLTDNYDKAVVLKAPEQIQMMDAMFTRLQEESISMIRHMEGLDSLQKLMSKMEGENRRWVPYILVNNIGALAVLDEEVVKRHIAEYTPELESAVKVQMERSRIYGKEPAVRFGTKSALLEFVQTGKLEYIPEHLYTPLDMDERICVLERLRDRWNSNQRFYFLNEGKFKVSDSLFVEAYSERDSIIGYFENQEEFSMYLLNEKGIASWIYQFLRYLEESELVLGQEETLSYVDEVILQLKNKY